MRPQDRRKAIRDLRMLCAERDIALTVEPKKSSHEALIFRDNKTGKAISLTIVHDTEISAGVIRGMLRYVAGLASNEEIVEAVRQLAALVRAILEIVFGS